MTTHDDTATVRILRTLDAADHELDETQHTRAAAALGRILDTDPAAPTPAPMHGSRRRGHRHLVYGGVAAVIVAVVTIPVITGGRPAFASWSPTPVELTGPRRAAVADACLTLQASDAGELAFDPAAHASVLVAEARGGWSYVVFTVPGLSQPKLHGSCLLPDDEVGDPARGQGGFFGSLGGADEAGGPAPDRDGVRQDEYGVGSIDDETFVHAEGRAGPEVVAIEITTASGRRVEASIDHGRWAAWWPAGDDSPGNPEVTGRPTYSVTMRDGAVTDEVRIPR